ncbi:aldose 1-epimerase [Evansella halocellulosilytica]|uniref:aldose 1-epimerase n=1 Tax=Evansella halocellulosilytica TaxID=2011013 RepID=UPI0015C729D7|nr:aldose 1-epimerase [Evansella halocellulosilytica]
MRYKLTKKVVEGIETLVLTDKETHTECEIVPSIGNNLIRFSHQGESFISIPPSVKKMKDEVTCYQYGSAILFPPNRVKKATFSYQNKTYHLPKNEDPNHLHGELCFKPWQVVDTSCDESNGCSITSQFKLQHHPTMMNYFPHDLTFTLTYVLKDGILELTGMVENQGEDESPYALGFHPYFPIPKGNEEQVHLRVPAIQEWPVTNEAFVEGLPRETNFSQAVAKGMTLEGVNALDCWLISLDQDEDAICEIYYTNTGKKLTYKLDSKAFPFLVIFKPDWTSAISLEPYSYVTDGFNLPWSHDRTGVKGIKPSEQIDFHLSIQVT